jgi:hypothetical protein
MFRYKYGLILSTHNNGYWDNDALQLLEESVSMIAHKFKTSVDLVEFQNLTGYFGPIPDSDLFKQIYKGLTIKRRPKDKKYVPNHGDVYGWIQDKNTYIAYGPQQNWIAGSIRGQNIIFHELGHILDKRANNRHTYALKLAANHCLPLQMAIAYIKVNEADVTADYGIGINSGLGVNFRSSTAEDEIWADLFASWVRNSFYSIKDKKDGRIFKNYVNSYMTTVTTDIAIDWALDTGHIGY